MHNATPEIMVTPRFDRSANSLGPGLQNKLNGTLHDFVRRYRSDPKQVAHQYDRVAHLASSDRALGTVLELKISGKDRLIAQWAPPRLTLVDVGNHELVERIGRQQIREAAAQAFPAPAGYWPDAGGGQSFFGDARSEAWEPRTGENDADWLYYLDDEQAAVVGQIRHAAQQMRHAAQRPDPGGKRHFVIVGGPGTGKTSILLSLLRSLTRDGYRVGIKMADPVREWVEATGADIGPHLVRDVSEVIDLDVLLYDDPGNLEELEFWSGLVGGGRGLAVAGFDPCQMTDDVDDDRYRSFLRTRGGEELSLLDCYRQRATVGQAAKRVIDSVAESSPYLAKEKVDAFRRARSHVNAISNELRFVSPGGVEKTVRNAVPGSVQSAVSEIRSRPSWGLPTPRLLLVVDDESAASEWPWKRLLGDLDHQRVSLRGLAAIKGLEFQWAIIAIGETLFSEIDRGFTGATRAGYQSRRLLRIPFSRARDGIFTFVAADLPREEAPGDRRRRAT